MRMLQLSLIALILSQPVLADTRPAPEFTQTDAAEWLNSPPLSLADLRGDVVLIDFWTFACWNCYRSFPWLNTLEATFADEPFRVIGVHSPEFEYEKDPAAVAEKIAEFELKHPVMIDNAHRYWRAIGNRYWPAFYLLDKQGNIRDVFIGETHAGDKQSKRIEAAIAALLAE